MSVTMPPHGLDWKQKKLFRRSGFGQIKLGGMEACLDMWNYQVLHQRSHGRSTLFELCDVIALVTSDTLSLNELDMIELRVHRVLPC